MDIEKMLENICISCDCDTETAQEHLDAEIRNLLELRDLDELRDTDCETACNSLGLEHDYLSYFAEALAS